MRVARKLVHSDSSATAQTAATRIASPIRRALRLDTPEM
jgi:hypothetical protein